MIPVDESSLPGTVGEALTWARALSRKHPALTPVTIQALLAQVTGHERAWLLAHPEARLSAGEAARFVTLLGRAASGEPLAYLTGEREFCGLPFHVTPEVLIPRPETEGIIDVVLEWAGAREQSGLRVADVGTGSGAIAVTLAVRLPAAKVVAVDISREALAVARGNAGRHGVAGRVNFVQADLLNALIGPFDVIVANLPYISHIALVALDVARWEPRVALDGGPDGLNLLRRLIRQAPRRLAPGGLLALEIGHDQGRQVRALCQQAFPSAQVSLLTDLTGLDRVIRVETA